MEVPLIEQFGQVEHSISGTIFFGPVEVPLIESRLYSLTQNCSSFSIVIQTEAHNVTEDTIVLLHLKKTLAKIYKKTHGPFDFRQRRMERHDSY